MASRTSLTSFTTSTPSTTSEVPRRHAQSDVEDGPVLGHVDVLAAEHGVAAAGQVGLLGQLQQQPDRSRR